VGALALLGGGIGGTLWANERSDTFNASNCAATNKAGCSDTLSQYHTARALEVTGFIGAGFATAAAATLFYLDRSHASSHGSTASRGTISCAIAGTGARCKLTF
jgi:hypothetical protein